MHDPHRYPLERFDRVLGAKNIPPSAEIGPANDQGRSAPPDVVDLAKAYAAKVPEAVAGQHGDDQTYRLACVLVRDFQLSHEQALGILEEYNERCIPRWSRSELIAKLRNALRYGTGRMGSKVPDSFLPPIGGEYERNELWTPKRASELGGEGTSPSRRSGNELGPSTSVSLTGTQFSDR